ncbi:MAG: MFS transporter [Bradyrhizobium sp.]|nr:MAG: MFS transporter [Bradyrhizobium sp.]
MHPDGLPVPQRYWSMLAIALGIAMSVLDAMVANIALPVIAHEFHAAPAETIWVVNAYQLAVVVTLLPFASLGERIGYRRVYFFGLSLFTIGSLACVVSASLPMLIVARVAQGLGAGGVFAVNGALVRFTYPQRLLGRGIGLNAFVVSVSSAIGPSVASAILAVGPWQWLFAINVPIGVINLVLAVRALPHSDRSHRPFDLVSASLNAVAFGLFFIGVDSLTHGEGQGLVAFCELAGAVLAAWALIRRESGAAAPLIPIDLLGIRIFALSVVTSICSFTAQSVAFVALPFYFELTLGRSQVETGLLMTPWPVAVAFAAPLAGRLADRFAPALLGSIGLTALAIGLAALSQLPADAGIVAIAWPMALCGAGFGFFQAPNNRILLSSAPRSRAGAAGGMLATARLTGLSAGATLAALIFRVAPGHAEPIALLVGAGFAVAAVLVSLTRLAKR